MTLFARSKPTVVRVIASAPLQIGETNIRSLGSGAVCPINGSLRDELLNEEMFDSLDDARRKLALWRYDYNNVRPHSALGNETTRRRTRAGRVSCLRAPHPARLRNPNTTNTKIHALLPENSAIQD